MRTRVVRRPSSQSSRLEIDDNQNSPKKTIFKLPSQEAPPEYSHNDQKLVGFNESLLSYCDKNSKKLNKLEV